MKKRASLSHPQFFQLCEAMKRDKEMTATMTQKDLAERYTNELNFLVSTHSVSKAAETVGAPLKTRAYDRNHNHEKRIADLEETVTGLREVVAVMEHQLHELKDTLSGTKHPEMFTGEMRNGSLLSAG